MRTLEEASRCLICADAPCSKVCKGGDPARVIRAIRFGNQAIARRWVEGCSEQDLEAAEKACIHCENPFFLASSAVCTNYEMVARVLEAGWGGVFYKTICMQEINEVFFFVPRAGTLTYWRK